VDPEPVGGVAADAGFQGGVDVPHQVFDAPAFAVFLHADGLANIQYPLPQAHAVADGHEDDALVPHGQDDRRAGGPGVVSEEGQLDAAAAIRLVAGQDEQLAAFRHRPFEIVRAGAAVHQDVAGDGAHPIHELVQLRRANAAIRGHGLIPGDQGGHAVGQLKIAEMAAGEDTVHQPPFRVHRPHPFGTFDGEDRAEPGIVHGHAFHRAGIHLPQPAEVFLGDVADFRRGLFIAEAAGQILQCHLAMPPIHPKSQRPSAAAQERNPAHRQRLNERQKGAGEEIEQMFHEEATKAAEAVVVASVLVNGAMDTRVECIACPPFKKSLL
jgi:hypothetical protein